MPALRDGRRRNSWYGSNRLARSRRTSSTVNTTTGSLVLTITPEVPLHGGGGLRNGVQARDEPLVRRAPDESGRTQGQKVVVDRCLWPSEHLGHVLKARPLRRERLERP